MPYGPISEGPGIGRATFADALKERRLGELLGGPFIELLQPGPDETVVQYLTDVALCGDVRGDLFAERVSVGKDPRQRHEDPRDPESGIAEKRSERCEPAEGETWRGDHGMRVQDAQ
jgi:hypothetical protein